MESRMNVTKIMPTKEFIKTDKGKQAARKEYDRMLHNEVWDKAPVDRSTIPDDALVVPGRLLMGIKNIEMDETHHIAKGRLIAQGCYVQWAQGGMYCDPQDYWAPTTSLSGARLVLAHAMAHGRDPETVDLASAYLQVQLKDDKEYYLILPKEMVDMLDEESKQNFLKLKNPVLRLRRALYGLRRAGYDFINTFRDHLIATGWQPLEGDVAVLYKQYGKDTHKDIALCATYVDDIVMSAPKKYRGQVWGEIAERFKFDDPRICDNFLGLKTKVTTRTTSADPSQPTTMILHQTEYAKMIVDTYEKAHNTALRTRAAPCLTLSKEEQDQALTDAINNDKKRGPDDAGITDDLEYDVTLPIWRVGENKIDGGKPARTPICSTLYLARGTRIDLAYATGCLARRVTKWDNDSKIHLQQMLGYIKGKPNYGLKFINCKDSWDSLQIELYCDADYNTPASTTGWILVLRGPNGSSYPIDWCSKRQQTTATSSCEAELVAMAHGTKALLRLAGMLDVIRTTPATCIRFTDNEAVRAAVTHGHSNKLAHMKKHVSVSLLFLKQVDADIRRVKGSDNSADVLTKPLPRSKLETLLADLMST